MQNKYLKFLIIILVVAFIVPQVTFASWWNPVSWGLWGKIWGMFNKTENTQQMVGNDKDSHGCIGSAGYSWCERKQKCLRPWEEKCEMLGDIFPTFSNLKWGDVVAKKITEPVSGVVIDGYEITTTGKIDDNVDASKFFNFYKKLSKSGWKIDNYFSADGILGSQVGYNNGGNYIVLSYTITPGRVTSGKNEPLQWVCPCQVKYTIFTGQSETGQCTKDSECPTKYKCINRTCQVAEQDNPIACTMDAKQCPDGSYVGRQGPKCEFAPCPNQ